jgi:hypothetical protein
MTKGEHTPRQLAHGPDLHASRRQAGDRQDAAGGERDDLRLDFPERATK